MKSALAGYALRVGFAMLGHSDPALTLRVYARAVPEDETDLSFADFDAPRRSLSPRRPLCGPSSRWALDYPHCARARSCCRNAEVGAPKCTRFRPRW